MAERWQGEVELVVHSPLDKPSGIGRYARELHRHLGEHIPVRLVRPVDPPLARRFGFLHHLPLGLEGHQPGSLVHFTQIMGCAMLLWRPVRPAVATVHDLGGLVWPPEWEAHNRLDRFLLWLSLQGLKRVDRIVAVSRATAQSVVERLGVPDERVAVVHEGVDHQLFRPVPEAGAVLEERYGLPTTGQGVRLLYVGSEAPRKNLGTLLAALARLRSDGMDARLIKVGGVGHPAYRAAFLEQLRRLGLEDGVSLVGEVPDADLPLFYSAADLFVLPSHVEGFGLPALEAMACGTPVVCSEAGALPEVVGDAARTVPAHDAQALADAVAAVLGDEELRGEMARAGRQRSRSFTWERAAAETAAVYGRVASGKTPLRRQKA